LRLIVPIHLGVGTIMSNAPASFFIFTLGFIISFFTWPAPVLDTPFGRVLVALRAKMSGACHLAVQLQCAGGGLCISGSHRVALWGALSHAARVRIPSCVLATSGNAVITVVTGGVGTLAGALYGTGLFHCAEVDYRLDYRTSPYSHWYLVHGDRDLPGRRV
jgi:branched-chain amino acid transport system permease protein